MQENPAGSARIQLSRMREIDQKIIESINVAPSAKLSLSLAPHPQSVEYQVQLLCSVAEAPFHW